MRKSLWAIRVCGVVLVVEAGIAAKNGDYGLAAAVAFGAALVVVFLWVAWIAERKDADGTA